MANPTSNFNWQMPTSSDLVTDLPADFETFGQAVDTSLADLKGGTTGQVLSKASNTDMDFTWVAQDDSNAIQNAIVDAKGDLIAATAADTPARLAVGTNGQVLTADSTAATGLNWTTPTVGMTNPMTTTGDTIYSSSGSTPARLGIGTSGQVLTVAGGVPTWASPTSASANYSLLNAGGTALTGAGTITVSGISGMSSLYILIQLASSASANSEFTMRFNSDSTNKYTINSMITFDSWDANNLNSLSSVKLGTMGSSATDRIVSNIFISGCNSSGAKIGNLSTAYNGSGGTARIGGFIYTGSSAISSVSVISSVGNFDNGTIFIYGSAV